MRNKLRIPILTAVFFSKEILSDFLKTKDINVIRKIIENYTSVMLEWKQNPDCRFGQLLSNMNLVSKEIEDRIWNIEENYWLIDNGYCNLEDIEVWGVNFYKNGNVRKKTKFKLLRDLDTDHIKNIIIFFEKYNSLDKLNKRYLEYFKKRINEIH